MDEERQAGRQAFPAGWGINGGLGRVMTVSAFWLYTISPVAVVMVMARRREVSIPVSQLLQGECKLSPGISPVEGVARGKVKEECGNRGRTNYLSLRTEEKEPLPSPFLFHYDALTSPPSFLHLPVVLFSPA